MTSPARRDDMSAPPAQTIEPHPLELLPTPGGLLEATRVATGMTIRQVAACLQVSSLEVALLESNRFGALSDHALVRNYISAYASLLDLPADMVLKLFDQQRQAPLPGANPAVAAKRRI